MDSCTAQPYPAIPLNNTGAKCIASGDLTSAIKYLSAAFSFCTAQAERYVEERRCCKAISATELLPTGIHIDDWMNKAAENRTENKLFFFDSPIRIPIFPLQPLRQVTAGADNEEDYWISSTIAITFNLGMAYYRLGLNGDQASIENKKQIQHALKSFQYSFQLQRTRCPRAAQSPLFYMAAINNLGVLYQLLGETQNSKECFERLLSILVYTIARNNGSANYEDFFQNIAAYASQNCSVCAGAA